MKMLTKRQDAIRAVADLRRSVKSEFPNKFLGGGWSTNAFSSGDKVVKIPTQVSIEVDKPGALKELTRRLFLKKRAYDKGLAPETFLVDSGKKRYLVEDRMLPLKSGDDYKNVPGTNRYPQEFMYDKLMDAGITGTDISHANMGWNPKTGKLNTIDLGYEKLIDYMPESERKEALQRFIQKNRKKEWLKD
jgi:hypothetical protein